MFVVAIELTDGHQSSSRQVAKRFARAWAAHKHRADSEERAGLIAAVLAYLKPGRKAVPTFYRLVGNEQEPAPKELEEHDESGAYLR